MSLLNRIVRFVKKLIGVANTAEVVREEAEPLPITKKDGTPPGLPTTKRGVGDTHNPRS